MTKKNTMSTKEILLAMASVIRDAFYLSPKIVLIQAVDSILSAVLPIITTYLAALTTTALADAYIGTEGAVDRVLLYVTLTVVAGVLSMIWNSIKNYIETLVRYKTDVLISDQMALHFLQIEFWRYDDAGTIDMFDRANRFAYMFPHLFSRASSLLSSVVSIVVALVTLSAVNPWLGLGLLIAVVPSLVIQMRLSRLSADHWRSNSQTRRRHDWISWRLIDKRSVVELRLYGLVDFLIDLRDRLRDKDEKSRIDFERKFIVKKLGADVFESVIELGALIWVIIEIVAHRQPIGQFLLVQQLAGRVLMGAGSIISVISEFDEDLPNLMDYKSFKELPISSGGEKELTEPMRRLEVDNISFRYTGSDNYALKGVSLSLENGQKIAIVGENGTGKTTLVKLITGIYNPEKGQIRVEGLDLRQVDIKSWHDQISLLSQEIIDYDFATANENVWFGNIKFPNNKERIERALKMAEASDFVGKLPKGGDSYINKWIDSEDGTSSVSLSGGQYQRLALARNFYRDAAVMILDEPTSAIDALAEARIFNRLFAMKDKTIIIVSHRLTTIRQADLVYMMKEGEIVETGSVDELIDKKGEFYRMFEMQI